MIFSCPAKAFPAVSKLISFTINGNPYQAEKGMTWENWVYSKYNTDGFDTNVNAVVDASFTYVVIGGATQSVRVNDEIVPDFAYTLVKMNKTMSS